MSTPRTSYPSDVSDEEWAFVAPYLTLMSEDALQRRHDLREVFNAVRWLVRTGAPWRMLPHDFPRWAAVYQQTQRWIWAGCFEAIVHDLRLLLRLRAGRGGQPTAVILDGRTVQSTPESGARAGYDDYKRRNGSKTHVAVDTLGYLLAVHVTPANEQERAPVGERAQQVREVTGEHVELASADDGTRATRRLVRRTSTASSWRSSSSLTRTDPSMALCCCPNAGLSSAASRGRPASAAWRATMSGCPKPWRA